MIEALFLLNSHGLKVASEVYSENMNFLGDAGLEMTLNAVYSHLNLDFPEKLPITPLGESGDFELYEGIFGYYFIIHKELYFVFTNKTVKKTLQKVFKDKQVQKFIARRQTEIEFFKGIFFSDWDDKAGPLPLYNQSPLAEEVLDILAVQGTTVLGMGMTDITEQLVGPIPVPKNQKYSFLVYMYRRPAPTSEDSRIISSGRPTTIFLIIDHAEHLDNEVNEFIKTFLDQWILSNAAREEYLYEEDLEQLNLDIRQTVILAKDLIIMRSLQESEFKKLLQRYSSENILLKTQNAELKLEISALKNESSKKSKRRRLIPTIRIRRRKSTEKSSKRSSKRSSKKSSKKISEVAQ